LRISCAITVESRPSAISRSRSDACCWKRASASVMESNVPASTRTSSSSHTRVDSGGAGVSVPVRAISRIEVVSAESGRVMVRATA
jgi:hypothetical protein